jgi:hypothetical protein
MPSYSRTRGAVVASEGFYVGSKGTETPAIVTPLIASFASASTAQTVYVIAPYAGNVSSAYVAADTASVAGTYTVKAGSAGNTIASGTSTTGVAGLVSTLTLGTVAVTAGQSISCLRAASGTAGASVLTLNIARTS